MTRTMYPDWYGVSRAGDVVTLSAGGLLGTDTRIDLLLSAPQALMIAHQLMQALVIGPEGGEPHLMGVVVRDDDTRDPMPEGVEEEHP